MQSRDAILQRIRTATAKIPPLQRPPVPEVWPRSNPTTEEMIERFGAELEAVQGEVLRCGSMDDARRRLAELANAAQWKTIGAADRDACRELAADLPPETVEWATQGWDPQQMAGLSAGLVAAERLLADTGTCVVANHTAEERLLCYLPPACVVVARTDQIVEHMPAAWQQISRRTAEAERRGEYVLVTGPSRTADIEKILILGVHGPKRLVVLLVD